MGFSQLKTYENPLRLLEGRGKRSPRNAKADHRSARTAMAQLLELSLPSIRSVLDLGVRECQHK